MEPTFNPKTSSTEFLTGPGDGRFVDAHLAYQPIVSLEDGPEAALVFYEALAERDQQPAVLWAHARLLPHEQRVVRLDHLARLHAAFAPLHYEIAKQYGPSEVGVQTLDERRREKAALERFAALDRSAGALAKHFIDYRVAADWRERAQARRLALTDVELAPSASPVAMIATPSNAGWLLYFAVPEEHDELQWRHSGAVEFAAAVGDTVNVPLGRATTSLQIRYRDHNERWQGPFEFRLDPSARLAAFAKETLQKLPGAWASIAAPAGDSYLYLATLVVYRCAISKVEYGFDVATPDQLFALDDCDPNKPFEIPDPTLDGLAVRVPGAARYASVRLTWYDGEITQTQRVERP